MDGWKPDPNLLGQAILILQVSNENFAIQILLHISYTQALRDPTRHDHTAALRSLDSEVVNPSFLLHILYIFSRGEADNGQVVSADLRQLGGLILKNNALNRFSELSSDIQSVMKSESLYAICNNLSEVSFSIHSYIFFYDMKIFQIRNIASILVKHIAYLNMKYYEILSFP